MYKGSYFPTVELQARMITMIFAGQLPYPTEQEMKRGLKEEEDIRYSIPKKISPHNDFVDFSDGIARVIGALPDMRELELSNPELYNEIYMMPFHPASYRLVGSHSNPEQSTKIIKQFPHSFWVLLIFLFQ